MRQFLYGLAVVGSLVSGNTFVQAQGKVAYVDIDRVTEHSRSVNKTFLEIESKIKAFQEEIDAKTKLLQSLRDEIKKGEGVVADTELKKKRADALKLEEDLTDLQYKGKREFQKLDATVFEPTIKEIILNIQEVAKEKNIDLVLRGEVVIYASDNVDITEAVIEKMNGQSASSGSSQATSAPASTGTTSSSVIQKSILPSLEKKAVKPASETPKQSTVRPVDRQKD